MRDVMIRVSNLTKYYGDFLAVRDVSFEVSKGEIVGLLGPNGAGKTTIMKIITGYLAATSGEAVVAGYDVLSESLNVRKHIGYLPESSPLYPDMNVYEYLKYISEIRKLSPEKAKKSIEEKVEICGLKPMLYRNIGALSKGYRQRVGLASVLLHDPEILILDEPTTGLDPKQIIDIRELIKKIGKKHTVILSTHILPEVEATCQKVIIINRGSIAVQGPTHELSHSLGKSDIVYVSFRDKEIEKIEKMLDSLEFVIKKEYETFGDDIVRFKLYVKPEPMVTEEIFSMAANNNLLLSELKRERLSLEDIFINLVTYDEMGGENEQNN